MNHHKMNEHAITNRMMYKVTGILKTVDYIFKSITNICTYRIEPSQALAEG